MNITLSHLIGTMQSIFKIKRLSIDSSSLTAARTATFPDKSGTVAMTSDIPVATTAIPEAFIFFLGG